MIIPTKYQFGLIIPNQVKIIVVMVFKQNGAMDKEWKGPKRDKNMHRIEIPREKITYQKLTR